jgi:outer membrane protein OmpA-like peptidoglycan-associated protein
LNRALHATEDILILVYSTAIGRLATALVVGGFIWSVTGVQASAQTAASDQIIHTLAPPVAATPPVPTPPAEPAASGAPAVPGASAPSSIAGIPLERRNLSIKKNPTSAPEQPAAAAASDPDAAFVEGLRHRAQSLSIEESDHVAEIAKTRTKIDLEIEFDYDSATIAAKAAPQLIELGVALRSPQLQNAVLVIGGHTDAKGSDQYNQDLSQRRSEAVKDYLVNMFKIPAANLITAGYGKRDLKNKIDPYAAENRRVEIVNMSARFQASR